MSEVFNQHMQSSTETQVKQFGSQPAGNDDEHSMKVSSRATPAVWTVCGNPLQGVVLCRLLEQVKVNRQVQLTLEPVSEKGNWLGVSATGL